MAEWTGQAIYRDTEGHLPRDNIQVSVVFQLPEKQQNQVGNIRASYND